MNNSSQSTNQKPQPTFANAPLKKKIGFFSAMLVVIDSSVGAGIFLRAGGVLSNSQNSIILAIFCWLIAGFAVIAMALALVEVASGRNDNLSVIGWCQTFCSRYVYKACKNFMAFVYLPLSYFFLPLYVILSIQDGVSAIIPNYSGLGTSQDWAIIMVIAVCLGIWYIVVNGLSSHYGNIQSWITSSLKAVPLLFAVIAGFTILGIGGIQGQFAAGFVRSASSPSTTFTNLTPGFGMFIAIGTIFFAYDGFYVCTGLQTEMKEPKKTPKAVLTGLGVVTTIYLTIAIAMSLGSEDGTAYGFQKFLTDHNLSWMYATFQILIGIGILGIINGFSLWSTRFMEDLVAANELPFSTKFVKYIIPHRARVGVGYNMALGTPACILFCIIGGLGYLDATGYGSTYGTGAAKMYSFADLMGNWTAVLAFSFIILAIAGALRNRKTNHVIVVRTKAFVPMAYTACVLMTFPIFMTFFAPIADLFMLYQIPVPIESNSYQEYVSSALVPRLMSVIVLCLIVSLMFLPTIIEDIKHKKKHGSVQEGELHKIKMLAAALNISFTQALVTAIAKTKRQFLNPAEQAALGVKTYAEMQTKYAAVLKQN